MRIKRAFALSILMAWSSITLGWGDYERIECLEDRQQLPVYRAVVVLKSGAYTGTVVIIAPGYALTAAHLVDRPIASFSVMTPEGPRAASVVASDVPNDIALLALDTTGLDSLPLYFGDLKPGRAVWTAGFPEEAGISFKGPLLKAEKGLLYVGAPVLPGMSGGPVIACEGGSPYMVGIISSFDYRVYRTLAFPFGGLYQEVVNTGTSNATGSLMISVFIQYAKEQYEEKNGSKSK